MGIFGFGLLILKIKTWKRSKGKNLKDFKNFFLPNNFEKNDKVIMNYFLKQNISMSELHFYATKQIHAQLGKLLEYRHSRIKETDFFIAEINDWEKMSKILNKYITAL